MLTVVQFAGPCDILLDYILEVTTMFRVFCSVLKIVQHSNAEIAIASETTVDELFGVSLPPDADLG